MNHLPEELFNACPEKTLRIAPGFQIRVFSAPDVDSFLDFYIKTQPDNVDAIPYYAVIWDAARALAKHLVASGNKISGKRIIELGCGLGLPSITAAKLGADVTSSDFHPDCRPFLMRNAANNDVKLRFRRLDWRKIPDDIGTFDIVMASDVLYDSKHIPYLVSAAAKLCGEKGVILVADPGRSGLQHAADIFAENGWKHKLHPVGDIFVIEFKHK